MRKSGNGYFVGKIDQERIMGKTMLSYDISSTIVFCPRLFFVVNLCHEYGEERAPLSEY